MSTYPTSVQAIQAFNQHREPERLALKYQAMRQNPFAFFRGTCHLFYQNLPQENVLDQSPAAWICGDLHLENFGSYKADNRLVYFDLNDFDEAILAPCSWDLVRFLTSILVGAETLQLAHHDAIQLGQQFLKDYATTLAGGKAYWLERSTATGMIEDLLKDLKNRSRVDFLAQRTVIRHDHCQLRIDGKKTLAAAKSDYQRVAQAMQQFAATQEHPSFFKVLDIARRIAGTGSLGLERYVILVNGKGQPDGHYLLDLKHQISSSVRSILPQPTWSNEAERVITVQRHAQAVAPAFLTAITIEQHAYALRELSPTQDRLCLELWRGKLQRLKKVMQAMGMLVASAHLRSGSWRGAATTDEWMEFGARTDWQTPLLDYAKSYHQQVKQDWQHFSDAFDSGWFN